MEDIAAEGNITKVTLYSYFQSKENLYMALTYRAMLELKNKYENILDEFGSNSGLELILKLFEGFMDYCEDNFLYSELMLDYFALNRSTSHDKDHQKLTEAIKQSPYFESLQEIQNYPFKICANTIAKGVQDGSIKKECDPMFFTLHGWTIIIGYVKILAASGDIANPIFKVDLKEIKHFNLKLTRDILANDK
jgi:AcrR family transcriptional regulator